MARLEKSPTMRSHELWVWMMTGHRFEFSFDMRPTEIFVRAVVDRGTPT